MDFTFTEDQILFRDSVKDFFANEVSTESIRARWETDTGRSSELWAALAELGLTGMLVPEAQGGLGMSEVDFVMLAEECGRVALPEPLVDTVLVATPLLAMCAAKPGCQNIVEPLLTRIAAGEAAIAVQAQEGQLLADAEFAEQLIMHKGDAVWLVAAVDTKMTRQESVDPSRRLFEVEWSTESAVQLLSGADAAQAQQSLFNRGALGCAAQLLGLAQRMIELSVNYTAERKQFGKAVGSFQAVKHHMANVAVQTEFAKAPVHRAAYSVAHNFGDVDQHVSQAKLLASEAALSAAKSGIQVHGAMGYTWEVDLHLFMKRAWALDSAWGTRAEHKARYAKALFSAQPLAGAGSTFAA